MCDDFFDVVVGFFVECGYYGISFVDVVVEFGVSKQVVLYWFLIKEKFYGEVFQCMVEQFEIQFEEFVFSDEFVDEQLFVFFLVVGFFGCMFLMWMIFCELFDNVLWVEIVGIWYLKSFFEGFIECVCVVFGWERVLCL